MCGHFWMRCPHFLQPRHWYGSYVVVLYAPLAFDPYGPLLFDPYAPLPVDPKVPFDRGLLSMWIVGVVESTYVKCEGMFGNYIWILHRCYVEIDKTEVSGFMKAFVVDVR